MKKFKYLMLFSFCCILFFSCETKKTNTETSIEANHNDTIVVDLDASELRKDEAQLTQLDFELAIVMYGEPQEKEFIKIKKENIPNNLKELIKKHYPNKEYINTNVEILEASWQLQDQSWIQVWYKLENDKWIPIDILTTV